jgi:acyl-CoA reductase-like NAD-dependent aldehyde dehydrogenase
MDPRKSEFIRNTRAALASCPPELEACLLRESRRTPADLGLEITQTLRYLDSLEEGWSSLSPGEPYGEALVLGSCVWPLFHAIQFGAALLLTGNRPTLKPSERLEATSTAIHDALRSADSGWEELRLQTGDRELGRRLLCSGEFDLILFQGTYEAGMRVLQDTLPMPGKEVLLYSGAKNPLILLGRPDPAMLDAALADAFGEGGQHCLSASLIFVQADHLDAFSEEFALRAAKEPLRLMDSGIQDRYLKFTSLAEKEGAGIRLRGKPLALPDGSEGVLPTVAVFRELSPREFQRSTLLQTEVFGPNVSIIGYRDPVEVKALLANSSYGLACGVHSSDPGSAREWARELPFSRIRINGRLLGMDPWKSGRPFRRSGNHGVLGAGLFAQITRPRGID